jgi:hypothetical protein
MTANDRIGPGKNDQVVESGTGCANVTTVDKGTVRDHCCTSSSTRSRTNTFSVHTPALQKCNFRAKRLQLHFASIFSRLSP